jgi:hypothetical protein
VAGHAHRRAPNVGCGHDGRRCLIQNFSAVTAACLAIRRDVYLDVGGFDGENLPTHFNDVDFCLKLLMAGYVNVWTPYAELLHHESASRPRPETDRNEVAVVALATDYIRLRWGRFLSKDPAYNPNLTIDCEDFGLAWPPRWIPPWTEDAACAGTSSARLARFEPGVGSSG